MTIFSKHEQTNQTMTLPSLSDCDLAMHCHGTAVQLDRRVFAGKLPTWSAGLLKGDAMAH